MTKVGELISRAQPVVIGLCTKGINFVGSLDTHGKARSEFYKNVRATWLNETAARSLYARISQFDLKDHPHKVWGGIATLTFFVCLFWRLGGKDPEITFYPLPFPQV